MTIHFFVIAFFLSGILLSCGEKENGSHVTSVATTATAQGRGYRIVPFDPSKQPQKPVSTISLPFKITAQKLQQVAISNMPQVFYRHSGRREKDVPDNVTTQVIISKTAEPTIQVANNAITMSVPVIAKIRLDIDLFLASEFKKSDVRAIIVLTIIPRFGNDFSFDPDVQINYHLLHGATFNLFLFKVNIVKMVRETISGELAKIRTTILSDLKKISIREKAQEAWQSLHEPMMIGNDYWVHVVPRKVAITDMQSINGDAVFDISLDAETSGGVGAMPSSGVIPPLPKLGHSVDKKGVSIHFPVIIPYKEIEAKMTSFEDEKIVVKEGHTVGFSHIKIGSSWQNELVVNTRMQYSVASDWFKNFRSDIDVTLIGKPHYDEKTGELSLDNLSYTAESENLLVAIGEWLLSPMILERLKKELKYNIGNQITQKRTELNDDVRDIVVADAICLHNSIDTLDLKNIGVQPKHLNVTLEAHGTISANLGLACEGR